MGSSVLLYGTDPDLLSTRKMVLERTGLRVLTAYDVAGVMLHSRESTIHLLILCHTLRADERDEAIAVVAHTCPQAKSIVLTRSYLTPDVGLSRTVVSSATGPQGLLATVNHLLYCAPAG